MIIFVVTATWKRYNSNLTKSVGLRSEDIFNVIVAEIGRSTGTVPFLGLVAQPNLQKHVDNRRSETHGVMLGSVFIRQAEGYKSVGFRRRLAKTIHGKMNLSPPPPQAQFPISIRETFGISISFVAHESYLVVVGQRSFPKDESTPDVVTSYTIKMGCTRDSTSYSRVNIPLRLSQYDCR